MNKFYYYILNAIVIWRLYILDSTVKDVSPVPYIIYIMFYPLIPMIILFIEDKYNEMRGSKIYRR